MSTSSSVVARIPERFLPAMLFLSVIMALGGGYAMVRALESTETLGAGRAVVLLGGQAAIHSSASAVFGNGHIALEKHAILFLVGVSIQVGGMPLALRVTARSR